MNESWVSENGLTNNGTGSRLKMSEKGANIQRKPLKHLQKARTTVQNHLKNKSKMLRNEGGLKPFAHYCTRHRYFKKK